MVFGNKVCEPAGTKFMDDTHVKEWWSLEKKYTLNTHNAQNQSVKQRLESSHSLY